MPITYNEKTHIFQINTENTTYLLGVYDGQYLMHLYYGERMEDTDCAYLFGRPENDQERHNLKRDRAPFFGTAAFEYPAAGTGDFRDNTLCVRDVGGHRVCQLSYDGYQILAGKPKLDGLPATFGDSAETLEITLRDKLLGLKVLLRYSIFPDCDAITRSVKFVNEGTERLYLERVPSVCLDMENEGFTLTTLQGAWGKERRMVKTPLTPGKHAVGSICGKTSHEAQPFLMVSDAGATQTRGRVYGMNLIYSGNFLAEAEADTFDRLRLSLGIHPDGFCWVLEPEKTFDTPEAVLVYSAKGIGPMTRCFHRLYRQHLIRSPYLHRDRPILINNWEATYFNFDDEKLLSIAGEAKKLGVEMLVMDDGWFGKRDGDESGLGDWQVNEKKIRCGLKKLSENIHAEGMKFGIWFEPEMVSPDSDLNRAHPDWAIQVPGREITMGRHQYVLDITRPEVEDYVYGCMAKILRSAEIDYVKWDMNRVLTDIGSYALDADHAGEFFHRYVLALYRMQERLITEFPALLLENCCGGGGRFDAGMLYYSPQIWTSDNMDPVQRLYIQEGTALVYPISTMGAHVCCTQNHITGRHTPIRTRGRVALAGTFGYELDATQLSEEDRQVVRELNEEYHRYTHIGRDGEYYRLASVRENGQYDAWMTVSEDKREALLTYVQVNHDRDWTPSRLRLEGLDPKAKYRAEQTGIVYSGEALMKAGYLQRVLWGDFETEITYFVREDV